MKKFLDILSPMAMSVEPVGGARLAAAIVHKNKIVSFGYNQNKSHTFHAKYSHKDEAIFWHAETHAIYNALRVIGTDTLKKCSLVICRMKTDYIGNWCFGLAMPCPGCMNCIEDFGIRRVVYSMDTESEYDLHYGVLEK